MCIFFKMDAPKRVKVCFVKGCFSNSVGFPDKVFFTVPKNESRRKTWFEKAGQLYLGFNSTKFCCEDHFNLENDMENFTRWKMIGGRKLIRPDAVPTRNLGKQVNAKILYKDLPNDMDHNEHHSMGCIPPKIQCRPDQDNIAPTTTDRPYIAKKRKNVNNEEDDDGSIDTQYLDSPIGSTGTESIDIIINNIKKEESSNDFEDTNSSLLEAQYNLITTFQNLVFGTCSLEEIDIIKKIVASIDPTLNAARNNSTSHVLENIRNSPRIKIEPDL